MPSQLLPLNSHCIVISRYSLFSITRVINIFHGSHEILERQSHYELVWRPFMSRSFKYRDEIYVGLSFCEGIVDCGTHSTGWIVHKGFGSFKACQTKDSVCLCRVHEKRTMSGSVSNLSRGPKIRNLPLYTGLSCLPTEASATFF